MLLDEELQFRDRFLVKSPERFLFVKDWMHSRGGIKSRQPRPRQKSSIPGFPYRRIPLIPETAWPKKTPAQMRRGFPSDPARLGDLRDPDLAGGFPPFRISQDGRYLGNDCDHAQHHHTSLEETRERRAVLRTPGCVAS